MNNIETFFDKNLRPLNKLKIFVIIVFIICDILGLAQPYILGMILDALSGSGDDIIYHFLIDIGLLLVSCILNFIQNYYWFKMINLGANITRKALFQDVFKQSFSVFKSLDKGDILNRLINESASLSESKLITAPMYILNISTLIIVFVFLFIQDRLLALVVLAFSFVYFLYYGFLNKKLRKYAKLERESYARLLNKTEEALSGFDAIKKNQAEGYLMIA